MKARIIAAVLVTLAVTDAHADPKPYLLGLAPTIGQQFSVPEGRILSKYLSTALKHPVASQAFDSYEALTEELEKGDIDFAWINPYSYVQASGRSRIIPIAKTIRGGESYRSVFIVRADSPLKTLADLKGLKVAWVDKGSAAGYLFPRAMLVKEHLDPTTMFSKETFAGTHKGVCDGVLVGVVDVGATFHTGDDPGDFRPDGCILSLGSEPAAKLRGIAVSDPIPTEVIVGKPGLDRALALRLGAALAQMSDTKEGKQVLSAVFHADGFGAPLDSDFDSVRAVAAALASGVLTEKESKTIGEPPKLVPHEIADPEEPSVIHFAMGSSEIIHDSVRIINRVARMLSDNPKLKVRVDGYGAALGPSSERQDVSKRRANAVVAHLLHAGVAATRIESHGLADSNPAAPNNDETGRAANRRVVMTLVDGDEK